MGVKNDPKQSEQDFVRDVNNLFLKSTAFATIFGAWLTLLTQPRGSLLYRRPGPWFWRLVPVYGIYECIVISLLVLAVLLKVRSLRGFCAACMIYRGSNYRRHSGKATTDIVRIITSQSGYQSGRLFNTTTTVPVRPAQDLRRGGGSAGVSALPRFC